MVAGRAADGQGAGRAGGQRRSGRHGALCAPVGGLPGARHDGTARVQRVEAQLAFDVTRLGAWQPHARMPHHAQGRVLVAGSHPLRPGGAQKVDISHLVHGQDGCHAGIQWRVHLAQAGGLKGCAHALGSHRQLKARDQAATDQLTMAVVGVVVGAVPGFHGRAPGAQAVPKAKSRPGAAANSARV